MKEYEVTPEIKAAVSEKAVDGKIACPVARKLAEDLGVSYKAVGEAANELSIKMHSCDLGCF
jgi:DNA-binding transcriptional regulator YhcF (GntR family)